MAMTRIFDQAIGRRPWPQVLDEHLECIQNLQALEKEIERAAGHVSLALARGNKIMACGNGGSAADCQHFVAEIVGRFNCNRQGWAAVALTTDTSILTALGNDFGFDQVFSRQVEALGSEGDVLVGISTSGCSANVIRAFEIASRKRISTVALTGIADSSMARMADLAIRVPSKATARIQEAHILILHFWAEAIERAMTGRPKERSQCS